MPALRRAVPPLAKRCTPAATHREEAVIGRGERVEGDIEAAAAAGVPTSGVLKPPP
jgi:hypothetical protein